MDEEEDTSRHKFVGPTNPWTGWQNVGWIVNIVIRRTTLGPLYHHMTTPNNIVFWILASLLAVDSRLFVCPSPHPPCHCRVQTVQRRNTHGYYPSRNHRGKGTSTPRFRIGSVESGQYPAVAVM